MQQINNEYDELFRRLKDVHTTADGKQYTKATNENLNEFKDIINKLIKLDVDVEICGSWLWVTGNTFQYRNILRELNFRCSNSKKAWYYHGEGYSRKGRKIYTLDEIRSLYGSEKITSEPQLKLSIV